VGSRLVMGTQARNSGDNQSDGGLLASRASPPIYFWLATMKHCLSAYLLPLQSPATTTRRANPPMYLRLALV
jgi:hypothetical protein